MMLGFYIFTGLVLGLPVLGVWPLYTATKSGNGASNTIVSITMPTHAAYGGDQAMWRAVFAEELTEHYVRWLISLSVVHLAMHFIPHDNSFGASYGAIVASMAANLAFITAPGQRVAEYFGKAAVIASGVSDPQQQAHGLSLYGGSAFAGISEKRLATGICCALPIARLLRVILFLRLRAVS